jgi:hypothetical protein
MGEMKDEKKGIGNREQGIVPAAVIPVNGDAPAPLDSAPLAYENSAFLNSADGRLIRIVSEYMEPLARFRRE